MKGHPNKRHHVLVVFLLDWHPRGPRFESLWGAQSFSPTQNQNSFENDAASRIVPARNMSTDFNWEGEEEKDG